jgi:hypothetical protein
MIPVFISLEETGRVRVDFLDPLRKGLPGRPPGELAESLIRQYAGLLEERWREAPGNIHWKLLEEFLKRHGSRETEG